MKIVLDTNRYRDMAGGVAEVVATVEAAHTVYVSYVTLGELRAGFRAGRRHDDNDKTLTRFLQRAGVVRLFADDRTTHHYAELYLQLRRQGTPIPDNDLWIAALVVQHGLTLYSRDRHFDHLPQIPRV